ncbi:uncharacterized protein LOC105428942 [Pogonomyrmex barbatus]|uniref:Uncharacterized protein LOC105428942 n=1 Tax=Pogonomyrmex barbatus TaxID=144034 RepID=A0A8N1S6E0_9HYME|nr:uncharacterized protein LOC105428942 [Pogonomyrmex barbatus]
MVLFVPLNRGNFDVFSIEIEQEFAALVVVGVAGRIEKCKNLTKLVRINAHLEPPAHIQTKTLLNLVSNFIREWGERPCETGSRDLKICKFCDSIINDETRQYARKYCCIEAEYLDQLLKEWLALHNTSELDSSIFTGTKYEVNYSNKNDSQKENSVKMHNHDNTELRLVTTANQDDIYIIFENYQNYSGSQIKSLTLARKTKTSAGEARRDDGTRNTDTMAERIRERRDNNPHQRELGEVAGKSRQDRRSAQRDAQEEANRSQIAVEKRRGDRDRENVMAAEEEEEKEKKESGERRNPGKNPYQQRYGEERETRLQGDNSGKKTGRLDRIEEKNVTVERKPAKRFERESGRRDRRENEESSVAHRDRRKGEEADTVLSKNKRLGSEKTLDSLGDAEKGRSTVNEEGKLPANSGKREDSSNLIQYQLSNAHFVELGWTQLPMTKIMRKIARYEARPAKPNINWFKKYRHLGTIYYDDGLTLFSRFHSDGSAELFYPNGVLAIRVCRPENRKYDMYTVFTPGGKDALAIERVSQILAIFDTMGYGVVFDMDGAARLSYNQIGGIFTDNPAGTPLVWAWNVNPRESILETVYTENISDRLQMDLFSPTNKSVKSSGNVKTPILPSSSRNKEKKVVEVQEPVVEERQEEVGNKIQLGTIVNFNKEVASCTVEASDWKSDVLMK